ncbi:MAG TPA: hypothetical protein DCZ94_05715 [Lentisphaeria bacterium]|nr:MAG: hypothetical protein A2X48_07235 [Lentisphaerae bacterium GWF2_49_21]HBC86432.1 hypothetical protein [Lentisphaeria bacterium]
MPKQKTSNVTRVIIRRKIHASVKSEAKLCGMKLQPFVEKSLGFAITNKGHFFEWLHKCNINPKGGMF